ncbi:MAG: hypothetical protein K2R98_04290 [Gemmataceae bacterium]|nr:hypothetical protein [Gemmataceae bacterium]
MVLILLVMAPIGCRNVAGPTLIAPKRFDGWTVRIACTDPAAAAVVERYARPWAAETGATVEVLRQEASSTADAWVIAPRELGHRVASRQLQAIPEPVISVLPANRYEWGDILPLYRSLLLQWDGRAYALPLLGDALVCLYREDRFRDPASQAAYEKKHGRALTAPATWEEFADIAEFFRQPSADKPLEHSLTPLPRGDGLAREFYAVAAPHVVRSIAEGSRQLPSPEAMYSFQFNFETGQPNLASAGFCQSLQLLQRLQACRPATDRDDPAAAFRDGKAVLCLTTLGWIARCSESGSPVQGKFAVCRVPGSRRVAASAKAETRDLGVDVNYAPYLGGGWLGVVPVSSPHPEAAFDLLAELSGPKTSREILADPASTGAPFRRSHFQKLEDWYSYGLGPGPTAALREQVRQDVDPLPVNPALRLRVPDERELQRVLNEELRKALANQTNAEQALVNVAQRWKALDPTKDAATRRAEYRMSLGR